MEERARERWVLLCPRPTISGLEAGITRTRSSSRRHAILPQYLVYHCLDYLDEVRRDAQALAVQYSLNEPTGLLTEWGQGLWWQGLWGHQLLDRG